MASIWRRTCGSNAPTGTDWSRCPATSCAPRCRWSGSSSATMASASTGSAGPGAMGPSPSSARRWNSSRSSASWSPARASSSRGTTASSPPIIATARPGSTGGRRSLTSQERREMPSDEGGAARAARGSLPPVAEAAPKGPDRRAAGRSEAGFRRFRGSPRGAGDGDEPGGGTGRSGEERGGLKLGAVPDWVALPEQFQELGGEQPDDCCARV